MCYTFKKKADKMNKAVQTLLATAVALFATNGENAELKAGIDALETLGENAKHTHNEYKALKDVVDAIEIAGAGTGDTQTDEEKQALIDAQAKADEDAKLQAQADAQAKLDKKAKAPVSMAGIRMIGNQWHHKSDSYKKGFSTAQECAEHFNK
jgi:hypothetical protein